MQEHDVKQFQWHMLQKSSYNTAMYFLRAYSYASTEQFAADVGKTMLFGVQGITDYYQKRLRATSLRKSISVLSDTAAWACHP